MVSVGTTCHIACHTLDMVIYIIEKCKRQPPMGAIPAEVFSCHEEVSDAEKAEVPLPHDGLSESHRQKKLLLRGARENDAAAL